MRNITLLLIILFTSFSNAQWVKRTEGSPSENILSGSLEIINAESVILVLYEYGSSEKHLYYTQNSGLTWIKLNKTFDEVHDISVTDKNNIWVNSRQSIYYTNDLGENWTLQYKDTTHYEYLNYIEMFDTNNGIASGEDGRIFFLKTIDGGKNWIKLNENYFEDAVSSNETIDFADINVGYCQPKYINSNDLNKFGVYKTQNSGIDWMKANLDFEIMDYMYIKFYDKNFGFINMQQNPHNTFYRTIDGGESWHPVFETDYRADDPGKFSFTKSNPRFVVSDAHKGFFYSVDSGLTWSQEIIDTNMNGNVRRIKFYNESTGWAVSAFGDIYFTNSFNPVTSIKHEILTPSQFLLFQNYPNPFNPETTIKFDIPETDFVTLKIYDVLGNEIKTLVYENKSPGSYNVKFNGGGLASGMYIYKLSTSRFTSIKKLLLVK